MWRLLTIGTVALAACVGVLDHDCRAWVTADDIIIIGGD